MSVCVCFFSFILIIVINVLLNSENFRKRLKIIAQDTDPEIVKSQAKSR